MSLKTLVYKKYIKLYRYFCTKKLLPFLIMYIIEYIVIFMLFVYAKYKEMNVILS